MANIEVRHAIEEDIADICLLLEILFLQEADFKPDIPKQRAAIKHLLAHPEQGQFLVMTLDKAVIGCVSLLYLPSTAEGGKVAILEDLVITPNQRHKGYGKRLLGRAIEHAKLAGCLRVTLLTDDTNQQAQTLYAAQGFIMSPMRVMRMKLPPH